MISPILDIFALNLSVTERNNSNEIFVTNLRSLCTELFLSMIDHNVLSSQVFVLKWMKRNVLKVHENSLQNKGAPDEKLSNKNNRIYLKFSSLEQNKNVRLWIVR